MNTPNRRMSTRSSVSPEHATHVALPNSPCEATTTLVMAASTNKITPVKVAKKNNYGRYYIFELTGTNGHEYFESKEDADSFVEEFKYLIKGGPRRFTSKERFLKAKEEYTLLDNIARSTSTLAKPVASTSAACAPSGDAKRILAGLSGDRKMDSFNAYFFTNSRSTKAAVVIRLNSFRGDESWVWKPEMMCGILVEIFKLKTHVDPLVHQAFKSLTCVPFPDLAKDPTGETQKVLSIKKKGSQDDAYTVQLFVALTYIEIPIDSLDSPLHEAKFLSDKINSFIETLKIEILSNTFKEVLASLHDSYCSKIFKEGIPYNIQSFVAKAVTRITRVTCFKSLLMRKTRDDINNELWATRSGTKYVTPVLEPADVPVLYLQVVPPKHDDGEQEMESTKSDTESDLPDLDEN
jgi:hypothetical protein